MGARRRAGGCESPDAPSRGTAASTGSTPSLLNEVLLAADATPHGYDAVSDAWGRPLVYCVHPPAEAGGEGHLRARPLGADGREGGERSARDLWFHEQRPVEEHETEGRKGIQQDLAVALGLVFQLDAMSDLSPKWRNVDATFTQVQDWLEDDVRCSSSPSTAARC